MFPRHHSTVLLVSLVLVCGLLGACSPPPPPVVGEIDVQPSTTIFVGGMATLTTKASGTDLQFRWTTARGNLSSSTTSSVIYTAPASPGPDTATIEVTGKGGSTVRSITFEVIVPPTPTPTPTPTLTPTEPSTLTPTATPTLTPTPVPPLAEIFPQVGYGEAFVFINQSGGLDHQYMEEEGCRHSGTYGLQLTYAMSGDGNGGWGVHWDKAPTGNFDASRFSALALWVIGAYGGETFQIGLKDTNDREVKVESGPLVVVSRSTWQMVKVELSHFRENGVNVASLRNLNFGFNRNHGSSIICIDDIAFE